MEMRPHFSFLLSALFPSALNYLKAPPPIWRGLSRQGRRNGKRRVHKLRNGPSALSNAKRLRWRRAQGFMSAAQIVMRARKRATLPGIR
jgi:hypothetical protein